MANDKSDAEILTNALQQIQSAVDGANSQVEGAKEKFDTTMSIIDKIKENIAWVLGLPAAVVGSFGFLWESSNEEAALQYQVDQLTEAVADLQSENDLLGGGTKNFSLDMSGAPGGSVTVLIIAGCLIITIGALIWYQRRRRRLR
tara:strand:+ start:143 stop:577 length:435 start_codon:yes stop_codon:yes gene_type:complete